MYSLLRVSYKQPVFLLAAIIIRILFLNISWYCYFAIIISLHQFFLLFSSIGFVIPIRYLFGSFMCLQMFVGPALAYNGLDEYQFELYKMQVSQAEYFAYT